MAMRTELEAAYRATTYRVYLPEGAMDLRVDTSSQGFAEWLGKNGVKQWAVMTAANPGSRRLTTRENAELQAKLECELLEAGYEPFVAENIADDESWPVEEGCLVTGISRESVMVLAQQFGQNAVLLGEADGMPRLAWTEECGA